jgi:hypothetical protein
MDPVTLIYYGAICGLLAVAAPRLTPTVVRLLCGVVVGLVAAGVLPALRGVLGL